jgi:outer membrane protein OmpA-like peptidoglycan-associated protein
LDIVNSRRSKYVADFSAGNELQGVDVSLQLDVHKADGMNFVDSIVYPLQLERMYSDYQVLASYSVGNTRLDEEFLPNINDLAKSLQSDKTLVVELIGNAGSIEGTDDDCNKIALKRAQNVRRYLIEAGADPTQIRVSSEGAARPLFQTSKTDWQYRYNNRVEIRWMQPEDYPYEIITDYPQSEEIAQQMVEDWEERGYMSYYQRIMKDAHPAYRVLIWGYQTEADAARTAEILSKEMNKKLMVK